MQGLLIHEESPIIGPKFDRPRNILTGQLQEFIRISKYARYNSKARRRETWKEQIDRVMDMHRQKYSAQLEESEYLREAFDRAQQAMYRKQILGAQRALHFGGAPILGKNARIYNCAATYMDRPLAFPEVMWLLLCGCGMGISVQKHHVEQLPAIRAPKLSTKGRARKVRIEDTIEGWADALGSLLASYFVSKGPVSAAQSRLFDAKYSGRVVQFIYEDIRPKGSAISNIAGRAPGPEPLRNAIEKIRKLLDRCCAAGQHKLRPIDVFDIVMHAADAVISGGVRRSAVLTIFSFDDMEMAAAKTGMWFDENPQRGRSNNSALLLRGKVTFEEFERLIKHTKEFGEPGFIWSDDAEMLFNPCVTADAHIETSNGRSEMVADLIGKPFTANVDGKSFECKRGFVSTGQKPVYELQTAEGYGLHATADHKICTPSGYVKLADLKFGDKICVMTTKIDKMDPIMRDLLRKIFTPREDMIDKQSISIMFESSALWHVRYIQLTLLRHGIQSNIVSNVYVISDTKEFVRLVMELEEKPEEKLATQFVAHVTTVTARGVADVFDATIEDAHAFIANGIKVHNCVEVGLYAKDEEGNSGVEFCNLTEINMSCIESAEDFFAACDVAAVIGTLQAGYTDFPYLGPITEKIVRREALLGVGMTGMMDSPEIAFNPLIQQQGARRVLAMNKRIAAIIGINPAARATCVKPAGTTSCILGTASGIHPHHARRYFRRVQMNKIDNALRFFEKYNPGAVVPSDYNPNDSVITFLCETKEPSKTRKQMNAVELLEMVKLTQMNWVTFGKDEKLCTKPFLSHNVSNTITVAPDEWDTVAYMIYDNREYFAGVSLLGESGDRDYAQAPFQEVYTSAQLSEMYGEAANFASGLIVWAHAAFDNNLYRACRSLVVDRKIVDEQFTPKLDASIGERSKLNEQRLWIARADQFARRYFDKKNDRLPPTKESILKTAYCMKDVDALKQWTDLSRDYVDVPWEQFYEKDDVTKPEHIAACAGGMCER